MTKKASQRDRMMNRTLPSVTQAIAIDDPTAALRALAHAERVHQHAIRSGNEAEIKRTKTALTRAKTSSQSTELYCWALLLVTLVTFLRSRLSASRSADP